MLKKAIRKPDFTRRAVWFNVFPHLPLTKKSKGMRMGKGAGKLNAWQSHLRGGVFVYEFKNLRRGRAIHFFKRTRVKLPTPTKIVFGSTRSVKYLGRRSLNFKSNFFW